MDREGRLERSQLLLEGEEVTICYIEGLEQVNIVLSALVLIELQ